MFDPVASRVGDYSFLWAKNALTAYFGQAEFVTSAIDEASSRSRSMAK